MCDWESGGLATEHNPYEFVYCRHFYESRLGQAWVIWAVGIYMQIPGMTPCRHIVVIFSSSLLSLLFGFPFPSSAALSPASLFIRPSLYLTSIPCLPLRCLVMHCHACTIPFVFSLIFASRCPTILGRGVRRTWSIGPWTIPPTRGLLPWLNVLTRQLEPVEERGDWQPPLLGGVSTPPLLLSSTHSPVGYPNNTFYVDCPPNS
ncbi:unnamed protein product [Protopolystoma xenopodis]|uniref:Uncharacterized protein n=1 Tax=Protopolystoma xenopodis TaxID=117903 RepID=A0A448XCX4_9PLAT|nr:unnamed protein product [Protopolystoma xenopodis]